MILLAGGPPPRLEALQELGVATRVVASADAVLEGVEPGCAVGVLVACSADARGVDRVRHVVAQAGAVPVIAVIAEAGVEPEVAYDLRLAGATEVLEADDDVALRDVVTHLSAPADESRDDAEGDEPALPLAAPLAAVSAALGAAVLLGWWLELSAITTVVPGLPAMKANSAVMFVLLGGATVGLAQRRSSVLVQALAAVVALIAFVTIAEWIAGRSLGVDTVLTGDPQGRIPGRPSPYTASAFALGSAAVIAFARRPTRVRLADGLLLTFLLAVEFAVVGFAYGEQGLTDASRATAMAPHTAIGLLLLAVAIPAARPDVPPVSWLRGTDESKVLYRRLLPAAVALPPLLGGLRLLILGQDPDHVTLGVLVVAVSTVGVLLVLLAGVLRQLDELGRRRRRADAQLHEAEAQLRRLNVMSPTGIQELDADGRCVRVNPRWSLITGLPPREAWGDGWAASIAPDDRQAVMDALDELLRTRQELRLEHRVLRPDGEVRWVSARAQCIVGAQDQVVGAVKAIVDITDLKQAHGKTEAREELLRSMLDHWPGNAAVYRAADGVVELVNESGAAAMGLRPEQAIGRSIYELLPAEAAGLTRDRDASVLASGEPVVYEATLGGRQFTATKFLLPGTGERGRRLAAVGVDITQHVELQREFFAAQQDFRHAFEYAPAGIALATTAGRFVKVNGAFCAILGLDAEALLETTLRALVDPEDVEQLEEDLKLLLAGELAVLSTELRMIGSAADSIWVALRASVVRADDGSPLHVLAQILDVSERRLHEEQLQLMADRDPLTGLANRRCFMRNLERQVREVERYGPTGALLMLDLDHFKLVNDNLGHNAGDELIIGTAVALKRALRDVDVLARLGGDEFAILLPKADRAEAEHVADRIVTAVREEATVFDGSRRRHVTASVGMTMFDDTRRTPEELLVDADLAMYDAKEAGRDRWEHFASDHFAAPRMKARITWVDRLHRALEDHRFRLYAQPIMDLLTGRVDQYELLLRLIDEDGETIPPTVFLYIAERYDIVQEIDRWVAREAIRLLAEHPGVTLEANVSGKSLDDPELPRLVEEELHRRSVDPRRLVFEITETAAIANIQVARRFAERLGAIGCRFALDDFGAGFGSFYYLKHLPFDYLKIDGEFIANCRSSRTDQLVIEAVVSIARGLGKQTIAEFVTDAESQDFLRQQGVDHAQGFHVGPPRPIEEVIAGLPAAPEAPRPRRA